MDDSIITKTKYDNNNDKADSKKSTFINQIIGRGKYAIFNKYSFSLKFPFRF